MRRAFHTAVLLSVVAVTALVGATNVDTVYKWGWGENIGWMNWRDANGGTDGVYIGVKILSGYIWAENVGWVDTGDGTPAGGDHYANVDGTDYGVNVDNSDDLYGLAWGENIGWVNFDTRDKGIERASVDRPNHRLRGYVWGENVGWINLDDGSHYVVYCSCGDIDGNGGVVDLSDFNTFAVCFGLRAPTAQCPQAVFDCADLNQDNWVNLTDFNTFQVLFGTVNTKTPPNCP